VDVRDGWFGSTAAAQEEESEQDEPTGDADEDEDDEDGLGERDVAIAVVHHLEGGWTRRRLDEHDGTEERGIVGFRGTGEEEGVAGEIIMVSLADVKHFVLNEEGWAFFATVAKSSHGDWHVVHGQGGADGAKRHGFREGDEERLIAVEGHAVLTWVEDEVRVRSLPLPLARRQGVDQASRDDEPAAQDGTDPGAGRGANDGRCVHGHCFLVRVARNVGRRRGTNNG
jgi:hypothetical protein